MIAYPWHQPLLEQLDALCTAGELTHAIGLTCAEGWGLRELLTNAVAILLKHSVPDEIGEFAHPDFRWVEPDGMEIKIDQVRRISDFAVQTVQSAPRKVVAILQAHKLNERAANALLKTLEEPPADTHILLASTTWGKLLPTIRSRCQRFGSAPDQHLARQWLAQQGLAISESAYAECGYAPLTILQNMTGQDGHGEMDTWFADLAAGSLADNVAEALQSDVVALLGRWYRRIVQHLGGRPIAQLRAPDMRVLDFADQLLSARRQLETTNSANGRALMEGLLVRWSRLCNSP